MNIENKHNPESLDARSRILAAARDIFYENGYDGATTRLIAQKAEVNEVTIFRHFGNKENLFMAVVNEYSTAFSITDMTKVPPVTDPRLGLITMGKDLYSALSERRKEVITLLCESNHNDIVKNVMVKIPQNIQKNFATFFENQINNGNFKNHDPRLLATAFMGMFFSLVVFKNFLGGEISVDLSSDNIVEHYVTIFLDGIYNQDNMNSEAN